MQDDNFNEHLQLLPYLVSVPAIFEKANINQKHSLLNGVFKHGLSYNEGAYRTPYINPEFRHNLQKINKKGLLFVEQPSRDLDTIPFSAERGILFEHLEDILLIINSIKETENL